MLTRVALCSAALGATTAAAAGVKCKGCYAPMSPKTPKCSGVGCFSPTLQIGGCWTIPMGVRSVSAQKCDGSGVTFYEYATKDCSGPVNTTATMATGACANPAPGQAPAGVWASCECVADAKPVPAPVARPALKRCKDITDCATCITSRGGMEPAPCGWCERSNKCKDPQGLDSECMLDCVGKMMDYPNCKKHKCPAPGPTPPAPAPPAPSAGGQSCIPGQGCVPCAGATCPYPSAAACAAACGAPAPPTPPAPSGGEYACVNNQCVAASVGGVDKAACEAQCGSGPAPPTPPTPPAPVPPTPPAPTPPAPPAPTPPAPASGGPKAGQLYCGSVGGGIILTTNLTIGADGSSMNYYNHIVIAKTLIACPGEKYEFQAGVGCDPTVKGKAGCGTMDVTKTTSDPNDCLAKGGVAEGGAIHTFIYDGPDAGTIEAKDSKYGTVEMKLSTNGQC